MILYFKQIVFGKDNCSITISFFTENSETLLIPVNNLSNEIEKRYYRYH